MTVRQTLWLLFAAFIVYGATIPFHFAGDAASVLDKLRDLPLNPLISPQTGRRLSIPDVVQNVLLFLPFGALGFLAADRQLRRRRPLRRIAVVALLGLSLSVVVETLQLLTSDRVSSLGDVASDTAGALLGAIMAWRLRRTFAAGLRRLRAGGLADADELRPFAVASLVLAIAFWQPFDVTLDVSTFVSKVRALQNDLWQFTALHDEGTSLMLSALLAMTLASYLSVLGERHAGSRAAVLGLGFVVLLEASQLLIRSRMPGLWDALIASTGIAIGVTIWSAAGRILWPRFWLGVLVTATVGAAVLQMLSPFRIAAEYSAMGWFPFSVRTPFETLTHIIELVLLYFPLGFWLGSARSDVRGASAIGVVLTLAIAMPIEYLQGWIVGRSPEVADVGISVAGMWIGIRAYNGQRA